MNKIILGLAVVSTILMMICAICTMAFAHPIVILIIALAAFVVWLVNEKPFREGHDFIDNYMETKAH